VRTGPAVLVDGAHNPDAAAVLAETIAEAFDFDYTVIVLGMLADKDVHGVLEALHRSAEAFVVTAPVSERALDIDTLAEAAREWVDEDAVLTAPDLNAALMKALDLVAAADAERTGVVVTGSLYTVAGARLLLGREEAE
ncbi:bifunctional folylpolyglutamate synthase/dihydrofolate synthase, partial [Burkholderia multivorans]